MSKKEKKQQQKNPVNQSTPRLVDAEAKMEAETR